MIAADTEGTFRPERITQIAERFGVDPETGMSYALSGSSLTPGSPGQHHLRSCCQLRTPDGALEQGRRVLRQ